jgi:hypothetical protein
LILEIDALLEAAISKVVEQETRKQAEIAKVIE